MQQQLIENFPLLIGYTSPGQELRFLKKLESQG
jgi:hypothetical protein